MADVPLLCVLHLSVGDFDGVVHRAPLVSLVWMEMERRVGAPLRGGAAVGGRAERGCPFKRVTLRSQRCSDGRRAMALNGAADVCRGSVLMSQDHVALSFSEFSSNVEAFRSSRKGTIYLMPYQLIFVAKENREALTSFTMPFYLMNGCEIKQPVLGANYIKGTINAEPNGGWEGCATFKLTFINGGAIEFGQLMLRAAQQASRGAVQSDVCCYAFMPNSVGGMAPPMEVPMYPPAPSAMFVYPPPPPVGYYPGPSSTEGTMNYMPPPPYPGPMILPAGDGGQQMPTAPLSFAEGDGGVNGRQPNPPITYVPMEQPPPYSAYAKSQ